MVYLCHHRDPDTYDLNLVVNGNARIVGILTIGTSSIIIDGASAPPDASDQDTLT